jgi:hypothetical protein
MFLRAVKFWIVLSTLASLAGWMLSALGMLNKTGYAIFAAVVVMLAFIFRKSSLFAPVPWAQEFKKLRRRFLPAGRWRSPGFLAASFAVLAGLVFISGLLYAPNDHTGLSYRVPRILQWLQHERWFWIYTPNYRMNDRACGIEWLSAPLLLFLKSDRALFLLNFIPFVLMPGLIFSVWTRLGVRPRVAWCWMWLVPTGYCFLLQAGGIANDGFPAVYALAMMDFALRAKSNAERGNGTSSGESCTVDLGLSVLSAALMVGVKASNLPLGLPWAMVFFPALARLWTQRGTRNAECGTGKPICVFASLILLVVAVVVSFLPTALLNIRYLHDWSGLSIEHAGMDMKSPVAGVLGNSVLLVTGNFVPTFFPMAHWWNAHALSHFPGALVRMMDANFEGGYNTLGEMPTEDWAGIGFGISVLVVVSVVAGKVNAEGRRKNAEKGTHFTFHVSRLVLIAPWISLLVYCMKSGMVTPARLIAPYYPLLLPLLLIGAGQSRVVRQWWWRALAGGVVVLAFLALVVTPPRPLWPARTILGKAVAMHPGQAQLLRAQKVYEIYRLRPDPLAGIRQWFPPGLKVIGFLGTGDDLDISLWKPYGSRRVEPFQFEDSPEMIRKSGIEYGVVSALQLGVKNSTIEEWLQRAGADLIATTNATMTVSQGPEPWYLVRFK